MAYRKRMQTALQKLEELLSVPQVHWTQPAGGYTLWLHLTNDHLDEEQVLQTFGSWGVLVSPGRFHYSVSELRGVYFRISIGAVDEEQITEGVFRQANAINSLLA